MFSKWDPKNKQARGTEDRRLSDQKEYQPSNRSTRDDYNPKNKHEVGVKSLLAWQYVNSLIRALLLLFLC